MTKLRTHNFEDLLKHFPDIAAGGDNVFCRRARWHSHFEQNAGLSFAGRIILEIGCADASFLAAVAAAHPDIGFVGLDWKFKTLYTGAQRVAAAGLRNVMLLRGRAQDLPRIFAPGEVDEVWVFHPEPCAELPQRQNRLIAEPFLANVYNILRSTSSLLAIKTDHPGYYQWILALMGEREPAAFAAAREAATRGEKSAERGSLRLRARDLERPQDLPPPSAVARKQFALAATSPDFWNDPAILAHTAARAFDGAATPYESKFVKNRRPIHYVELAKR